MGNRDLFGTDGIRGLANVKLTPELALKVGQAAGLTFKHSKGTNRVVIGKDTRLSGYMLESALVAGFTSAGMNPLVLGPIPTAGVGMLTRSMRADVGVMLTASHNGFQDNGIKLFDSKGRKLSHDTELSIQQLIDSDLSRKIASSREIGRAKRIEDAQARYIELVKNTLSREVSFDGLRVVLDCANGAAYKVAPEALWEMGAEVVAVSVDPDGFNINHQCGSTAPESLMCKVKDMRADVGIALDGDADRVIMCDETGQLVNGDQILALLAEFWQREGVLRSSTVVGTIMSNGGLEQHLNMNHMSLERTAVGDHHVLEHMRDEKGKLRFNVGGEPTGHIILPDFSETSDGLMAAFQVLAILKRAREDGKKASEILHRFTPIPQKHVDIKKSGKALELAEVKDQIEECKRTLDGRGRLVVRPSGTEPVIRVMIESDDEDLANGVAALIENTIQTARV
ncbi:phosphoglucosamine mutase [Candidatus Kaiserbacteria bacterium]|nr:phosphoglucosamine mutase [Candidatus Kaiserbacteria bacterium]